MGKPVINELAFVLEQVREQRLNKEELGYVRDIAERAKERGKAARQSE